MPSSLINGFLGWLLASVWCSGGSGDYPTGNGVTVLVVPLYFELSCLSKSGSSAEWKLPGGKLPAMDKHHHSWWHQLQIKHLGSCVFPQKTREAELCHISWSPDVRGRNDALLPASEATNPQATSVWGLLWGNLITCLSCSGSFPLASYGGHFWRHGTGLGGLPASPCSYIFIYLSVTFGISTCFHWFYMALKWLALTTFLNFRKSHSKTFLKLESWDH